MARWRIFCILIPFAVLSACSNAPPHITGLYHQLAIVKNLDLDATYEQLSFFVQADDENGFKDIAHLYLTNDKAGIYWSFTPDSWEKRGSEGKWWIGSNSVVMPDGSPLPRGDYRIELADLSGTQSESSFVLDQPTIAEKDLVFPALSIHGNDVVVSGPYKKDTVTVIDPAGSFSARRDVTPGQIPLAQIMGRSPEPGRTLDLYVDSYDTQRHIVLITGPYRH